MGWRPGSLSGVSFLCVGYSSVPPVQPPFHSYAAPCLSPPSWLCFTVVECITTGLFYGALEVQGRQPLFDAPLSASPRIHCLLCCLLPLPSSLQGGRLGSTAVTGGATASAAAAAPPTPPAAEDGAEGCGTDGQQQPQEEQQQEQQRQEEQEQGWEGAGAAAGTTGGRNWVLWVELPAACEDRRGMGTGAEGTATQGARGEEGQAG